MSPPGGEAVAPLRVSAIGVGIALASHNIDVVAPSGGGVRAIVVTDPARIPMLSQLQVGDTITTVVSEALAVSIQPAPTHWF